MIQINNNAEAYLFSYMCKKANHSDIYKRILLANDLSNMYNIMFHSWVQKQSDNKWDTGKTYTMLSGSFKETFIIPTTAEGRLLIEILLHSERKHFDAEADTSNATRKAAVYAKVACDKITEEEGHFTFEYNFLYPELLGLKKFLQVAETDTNADCEYIVHAYKEYADELEKMTSKIIIVEHDIHGTYENFLLEEI